MTSSTVGENAGVHLRVIGMILEDHGLFKEPRISAIKEVVLRIIAELEPKTPGLEDIQDVLCFSNVPLVPKGAIRSALGELQTEGKIERNKTTKEYRLLAAVPPASDRLRDLLAACWQRHFAGCAYATPEHFRRAVSLLFAKYGCAAYSRLTSHAMASISIDEIVGSLGLEAAEQMIFRESFSEFIFSPDPADATLKVRLASTYILLRMNGAGNEERATLGMAFKNKKLLFDTNIIFELIGTNIGQVTSFLAALAEHGATAVVATETRKEFEKALRSTAEQIATLIRQGVNVSRLVEQRVIRGEWIKALLLENSLPSREQIFERVERLLAQVDGLLGSADVSLVTLECQAPNERTAERMASIKEFALKTRPFEKHDDVAYHDALLWEAVEDAPTRADLVLTQDRSLGHVRCNSRRVVIFWDDAVAFVLLGGAGEQGVADLVSHALAHDLDPSAAFLTVNDLQTIARMESTLLAGPPKALRDAARKLADVRHERFLSGASVPQDEVGRIVLSSISAYKDDRLAAEREREGRLKAEERATASEEAAASLRKEVAELASANGRLSENEKQLSETRAEAARLQAEVNENSRRKETEEKEKSENWDKLRRKRDWMLFSAMTMACAVVLVIAAFKVAPLLLAAVSIVSLLWNAVAQDTPPVSLKTVVLVATCLGAAATAVEKWPIVSAAIDAKGSQNSGARPVDSRPGQ